MGFVRGIIGLVFAIIFAVFAVANRQSVYVVWSPVYPALHLPVYLIALSMLALGFLLGSLMSWLNSIPVRWEKVRQSRKIKKLEKELGVAKETKEAKETKTEETETAAADWKILSRTGRS